MAHPPTLYALLDRCAVGEPELFPLLSAHLNGVVSAILSAGDGGWTQRQALDQLDHGQAVGVVPLSEPGRGPELADLGTEAVWDTGCRRFLLRTPRVAVPTTMPPAGLRAPAIAVIAARLKVGDRDEGLFPFVVTLRTAAGVAPGVVPAGESEPAAGAAVRFDRVALEPDALLGGGIASIDEDGRFHCEPTAREEQCRSVKGWLQGGRVGRAAATVATARAGVLVAARRAAARPAAGGETTVAREEFAQWLVADIARLYAATALANAVRTRFGTRRTSAGADAEERELLAALATPLLSSTALSVLNGCHERCGTVEDGGRDRLRDYPGRRPRRAPAARCRAAAARCRPAGGGRGDRVTR